VLKSLNICFFNVLSNIDSVESFPPLFMFTLFDGGSILAGLRSLASPNRFIFWGSIVSTGRFGGNPAAGAFGLWPGLGLKGAFTDNFRWVIGLCGATGGGAIGGGGRNGGGGDLIDLMLERDPFALGPLVAIFQAGMCELIGLNTCERDRKKNLKKSFRNAIEVEVVSIEKYKIIYKKG